jgi:SAM-dependent methyltransferase
MHASAKLNAQRFFDTYGPTFPDGAVVVDLGSMDVNGSLKEVCPDRFTYVGIDFAAGNNVDIVMKDPYRIPVFDSTVDILLASSVFEHSEFFWLLFMDVLRALKPKGLFYLNVPSNGAFHRHPVDCWRFYPDAAEALANYSKHQGLDSVFLESWFSKQSPDSEWNDYVSVFVQDKQHVNLYPNRMAFDTDRTGNKKWKVAPGDIYNGRFHGWARHNILDLQDFPEGGKSREQVAQEKAGRINIA